MGVVVPGDVDSVAPQVTSYVAASPRKRKRSIDAGAEGLLADPNGAAMMVDAAGVEATTVGADLSTSNGEAATDGSEPGSKRQKRAAGMGGGGNGNVSLAVPDGGDGIGDDDVVDLVR